MQEQARLGLANGIPDAVVQQNGDIVRLAPGKPGTIGQVRAGRLVLDGDIIAPADGDSIVMRRRIMNEGVVIVALDDKLNPLIDSLGLPLDEDYDDFVAEATRDIVRAIGKLKGRDGRSRTNVHEAARLAARRAAVRWAGKKPQVRVLLPTHGLD